MRLPTVQTGHRLPFRLFLAFVGWTRKEDAPDVLRVLMYRPEYFGHRFAELVQGLLRGQSVWKVSEREIMAAFVASLNQCPF
jgi:hypothetical protein